MSTRRLEATVWIAGEFQLVLRLIFGSMIYQDRMILKGSGADSSNRADFTLDTFWRKENNMNQTKAKLNPLISGGNIRPTPPI